MRAREIVLFRAGDSPASTRSGSRSKSISSGGTATAGVVLADHQFDDLGQIDVDMHQDIALDVEAHLRADEPWRL